MMRQCIVRERWRARRRQREVQDLQQSMAIVNRPVRLVEEARPVEQESRSISTHCDILSMFASMSQW